ncbi:MAG TPA: hypothetical protein VNO79_14275 [Actinomycetota bacterium]|nr:hypothetical protein [Actinomycetota bacterium]
MPIMIIGDAGGLRVRANGREGEILARVREAYDPGRHPLFGLLEHAIGDEDFRELVAYARWMLQLDLEDELARLVGTELDLVASNYDPDRAAVAHRIHDRSPEGASIVSPGVAAPEPVTLDLTLALCEAAREALRWELKKADVRPVSLRSDRAEAPQPNQVT